MVSGNAEFIASLSRQLGPKLAPRLNTKLKDQSTLLLLAIKNRNPGMVKALLKAGANANLAADDGLTPLHSAASICDVAIIHYLLHAGADALAKDAKGDYAIEAAIRARQSESVAALFDAMHSKKAKPSQALPYDRFMLLSVENNVATQVNTLLTKAKKNVVDKQGRNSLWFAANNTNVELMLNLLAAGVPADTPDSHQIHTRFTPDSHGRTRFYMDISRRCSLCAETLTATVNINHQTVSGETPLIAAARNGDVASTAWLLPQKADVELRNKQGNSALITAVQNDAIEVVRLLVNAGVNVSRKNKLGYSAIDIAEQKNKDILEVLRGRSLLDRF